MNNTNYATALTNISQRVSGLGNYPLYEDLENDWLNYMKNIFIPNSNPDAQLRIICCESGPENIENYMFSHALLGNVLNAQTDRYLQQIYNGVFPHIRTNALPTKENALIQLAQKNILILDLLPTHGIKLETNERQIINGSPYKDCIIDLPKILGLPYIPTINLNYVFAVPPSLYTLNFIQLLLPANFIDRGNLNIGQGHAPSRYALQHLIDNHLF